MEPGRLVGDPIENYVRNRRIEEGQHGILVELPEVAKEPSANRGISALGSLTRGTLLGRDPLPGDPNAFHRHGFPRCTEPVVNCHCS